MSVLEVGEDKPAQAKRVIEVLASKAKQSVLKALLDRGPLRASEIAKTLGLSIPTVTQHLEDLVSSGLVRVVHQEAKGPIYHLAARKVRLSIDLRLLLEAGHEKHVEQLVLNYLDERRKRGRLPSAPAVLDVKRVLRISVEEAILVADMINSSPATVVEVLEEEAMEALASGPLTVRQLADKLRVSEYWASLVASSLASKGLASFRDGRLVASIRPGD